MKRDYTNENIKAREKYKLNSSIKKERVKLYKLKNAEKIKVKNAEYRKQRKLNDPMYVFTESVRKLIAKGFKHKDLNKPCKTSEILGCSLNEFKVYIENQFESWMNWSNKGISKLPKTKWQIDHIIPISTAKTKEDIIRLNHYTNLRPLCSKENRDKGTKLI